MGENDETKPLSLAVLASMLEGDRWLCADAAAVHLGQMPRKTFLAIAAEPGFPAMVKLGKRRVWRKSEIDAFMEQRQAMQQRQRAA